MLSFVFAILLQILLARLVPTSKLMAAFFLVLAENRMLKRKLDSSGKRIRFSWFQRGVFVSLISKFPRIAKYLTIVSPNTVFKIWKNRLAKFWTRSSLHPRSSGRPGISKSTRDLILSIKKKNPSFGYRRIEGVLKTLCIEVSKETIRRVLKDGYKSGNLGSSGSWRKFLTLHWKSLFACDSFTVDTLGFKRFYVFFILELQSRRIVQTGITQNPNMTFVRNQLSGFMYDRLDQETWLIHDNSGELKHFDYKSLGIQGIATTPYSPNMNAYAERFVGSIRREILDRMLIFTEKQLRNVIREYIRWYNDIRPHQGIDNQTPNKSPPQALGTIKSTPVLFGLYSQFYRDAA